MSILVENDIETGIFESICDFLPHEEYEKLYNIVRKHLNRMEGHDGGFDIWFSAYQVSPDGYEWRMSRGIGADITLGTIMDVCWRTGGVWSVDDTDAVVSYILNILKTNYKFYQDYKEQKLIFRVDGIKKKQKDSPETASRRLDSLLEPEWHFAVDWWAPRES